MSFQTTINREKCHYYWEDCSLNACIREAKAQ